MREFADTQRAPGAGAGRAVAVAVAAAVATEVRQRMARLVTDVARSSIDAEAAEEIVAAAILSLDGLEETVLELVRLEVDAVERVPAAPRSVYWEVAAGDAA